MTRPRHTTKGCFFRDNLVALHFKYDQARRRFVEWAQNEIAVVPDFHKQILFRDEAHFWLNGYVNKQNCRIWSEANPQVYIETPLHPEKLTVWCALWAGGIIGPYFFKNDEGHNVTVNGDRYRAMITNFFIPELNNHDVQELWFQQDGATCHTARATIDLLKDTFGDRLISRFGPVNWPPRSCDLTPLDYFLWGYVKSLVYADKPQTLDHLENNLRRVIADIRPQMLEKVIESWTSRLDYIRASRGSPMPEIIFKIPDLTPSDFHLFLHLKSFLAGKHFNNDKELKENVSNWLKTQAATFYEEGIEKLVPRYDTCLQNFGSYVERLWIYSVSSVISSTFQGELPQFSKRKVMLHDSTQMSHIHLLFVIQSDSRPDGQSSGVCSEYRDDSESHRNARLQMP
ncbi:putative DD41D transposase [Trichonephila clavipes]|uniref:Putative DD41D transposase n=1 Tax=Trichonephila clavipes TaxID=2585209 RepID=A0A8X6W1J5_TRICX|nr:putative DD41D transposase [Trichonephila clavipes]